MTGWTVGRGPRGSGAAPVAPPGEPPVDPPPAGERLFPSASWLWDPIPANPALDPMSATWTANVTAAQPSANLHEYAVGIYEILPGETCPTYTINPSESWGGPTLTGVPIPDRAAPAVGTDHAMVVIDRRSGIVYEYWGAQKAGSTWTTYSMETYQYATSNGRNDGTTGVGPIGAGFSRYAGVVTRSGLEAAIAANTGLGHALVFATGFSAPSVFRFPAVKTDGSNTRGFANPVPEGARFQINPAFNVEASSLSPAMKVFTRTLQSHGGYNIDNGGHFQLICEGGDQALATPPTNPGDATAAGGWARALGFQWDYFGLGAIPWSQGRWLASWNGA